MRIGTCGNSARYRAMSYIAAFFITEMFKWYLRIRPNTHSGLLGPGECIKMRKVLLISWALTRINNLLGVRGVEFCPFGCFVGGKLQWQEETSWLL